MAKVKIILENGESQADAENALFKALELQSNGEAHNTEKFTDPAMENLEVTMSNLHKETLNKLLNQIFEEIDKETL